MSKKRHHPFISGDRPFSCLWCSKTFVNGSNCRKHKLKDHPRELAEFESKHGRGKQASQAEKSFTLNWIVKSQ